MKSKSDLAKNARIISIDIAYSAYESALKRNASRDVIEYRRKCYAEAVANHVERKLQGDENANSENSAEKQADRRPR